MDKKRAGVTEMPSISTIMRKAADIMISGGYIKGARENSKGAHCALGALGAASTGMSYKVPELLVETLSKMLPEKVGSDPYNGRNGEPQPDAFNLHQARVATWSNNLCDSAEDVACVMRATAELLEEESKEVAHGTEG